MKVRGLASSALAVGCGVLVASTAWSQGTKISASPVGLRAPKFAAPVRLKAGEAWIGLKRHYPSPVFQDMNGDGRLDLVIGDLPGALTVALRAPGDGFPVYAAESRLKGRDGKDLDFSNW
jgi:hypothetical protein